MNLSRYIYVAGGNDAKLLRRDHFLIFMFVFGIIIAMALRYVLPWLDSYLFEAGVMPGDVTGLRFSDVYPMIIPYMTVYTGATLVGAIYGFMLLDERDDHSIISMMVTPVSINRFISYRIGSAALLAFLMIIIMLYCVNIALLPTWQILLMAAGGSLTAPIAALFYATVAENKVQGFAYGKFAGVAGWAIIIGWFIGDPLQWLFGLFPPFLISKAYWMALTGQNLWWLALILGMVLQIVVIGILIKQFNRIIRRQ